VKITPCRAGGIPAHILADPRLSALADWGARLATLGISPGQSGNLSVRSGDGFVITRTEVELAAIRPADWVQVVGLDRLDDGDLQVTYLGDHVPSRDAFVHGTVYQHAPGAGAVFHLHDQLVLDRAGSLGLPGTEHHHPAGTPGSVREIEQFLGEHHGVDYFTLVDHGIVALGVDVDVAGWLVEDWHHRARALDP